MKVSKVFIDDQFNSRDNWFNFLRFMAAIMVIFSHSYGLLKLDSPLPFITSKVSFGSIAVYIFFIISGFLVFKSWDNEPCIARFLRKRVLRIFPALVVAVFLTFFVAGFFLTSLPAVEYFSNLEALRYLKNILLYKIRFNLPGVFENNLYARAVNGSLWTLPVECKMYLMVAVGGALKIINREYTLIMLFVISIMYMALYAIDNYSYRLGICFFMGGIFYLRRSVIVLDYRLFFLMLVWWLASFSTSYYLLSTMLCLPYITLYLAFMQQPAYIRSWASCGDASYGIYIYSFVVQQILIWYYHNMISPLYLFMYSTTISILLGYLSWHFIEKPMLHYKK